MTDSELEQKIVQYALEQGTGIVYEPESDDVYTTELEYRAAMAAGRKQRYVYADVIKGFMEHSRREQVIYAITASLSLLDFDEWQKIQEVLGIELCWDVARKINIILYDSDVNILELERPRYENLDADLNFIDLESLCKTVFNACLDPVSRKDLDYALRLVGIDLLALMRARCEHACCQAKVTSLFTEDKC